MPDDSSFDQRVRQAQHATKIREERLLREKTGLSESQIRRGGLRDFFRDVLGDFASRTPHRHGFQHPPKVQRREQHVAPRPFQGAGQNAAPAIGGGSFTFIINNSGILDTVTVARP